MNGLMGMISPPDPDPPLGGLLGLLRQALDPTTPGWTRRGVPGLVRGVVEGLQRNPVSTVADFSPVGDAKALGYDAPNAFAQGNTLGGMLALASAAPLVPNLGRLFHGTPDARAIRSDWFQPRTRSHRSMGNNGLEWEEVRQPTYFSTSRATAGTYADDSRAFDYQNAEPAVIQASVSPDASLLELDAGGTRFSQVSIDELRTQIPETRRAEFDRLIARYGDPTKVPTGRIRTGDIEAIADKMGYDGFVLRNVVDNYDGRGRSSDVVAVFDPNLIRRAP